MYYVRVLVLFMYGWIPKCTGQMIPFSLENLLFAGPRAYFSPYPPSMNMMPFGIDNLIGQAQFQSPFGMPSGYGGYSMGPLPFPLFPMPCEMICDPFSLFFANISMSVNQNQLVRPPDGGNSGGGGGGGGAGTTGRPPGAGGGAMPGMPPAPPGMGIPPGMVGPPGGGVPPGMVLPPGMPSGMPGMPGAGGQQGMPGMPGGGQRPGGGASPGGGSTTTPTRPPSGGGQQQQPISNYNAQYMYYYPQWCSGWCRFLYRPRPYLPPPPPPAPLPSMYPFPHSACLIFSWLGL